MANMNKYIREINRILRQAEIPIIGKVQDTGKHLVYVIRSADGPRKMFVSKTPGDRRNIQNLIAQAKRLSR